MADGFAITADIYADITDAEKQQFLDDVCARCPLHDNLLNGTEVLHSLVS
ncbi:hypothetical protein [Alkalimonas collagenimarina]